MPSNPENIFSNAKFYEAYVGRWSRLVAKQFIAWLAIPPESAWLDIGAGTGILSEVILQEKSPIKLIGLDSSKDYIEFARQRIHDQRVEFKLGDALNFSFDAPQFDVAVAGLLLNFLPSPQDAVKSMKQAVVKGALVAAYVWDYSGQMEMMRYFWDAAIKIDPAAREMDAGQRFSIARPENLKALFQSVDLVEVEVMALDIQTQFKDFDDYWLPFLGAQGSVSKYLHGLSEETRNVLREQIQADLPIRADGSITLNARAWAVKGRKNNTE